MWWHCKDCVAAGNSHRQRVVHALSFPQHLVVFELDMEDIKSE